MDSRLLKIPSKKTQVSSMFPDSLERTAPFPCHPPVNHLHSLAPQADTVARFLLTVKTEGVKT
jgi:hypothetical protein